jgi:AcrR family transcriptional regulator
MKANKEKIILNAARIVFLKYGFKRVTMHDIAEAAGISRPAVYLIFPNKEDVFKAVIKEMADQSLQEIKNGIHQFSLLRDKLMYACEMWSIRPYEIIRRSPESKELIECGHEFSKEVYEWAGMQFELQLVSILKSFVKQNPKAKYSLTLLARMIRNALRGFKEGAKDAAELRKMIENFLDIILFSF